MRHLFPLRPLNLASLLTRPWLDDIFNLFVQRSLAHWGNKKRREMSRKKDELSSKHICVRQRAMCCSNLWEHLCLKHEGAFITFLLSLWRQKNFNVTLGQYITLDVPPWHGEALSTHPPLIFRLHSVAPTPSSPMFQDVNKVLAQKRRGPRRENRFKWRCSLCSVG